MGADGAGASEAGGRPRVFVALLLGEPLAREAFARVRPALEAAGRGVRPVRPEGLHLTLVFLGDAPRARLDDLAARLVEAAGTAAPRLAVTGGGAFPGPGRPRVLWLGVEEEPGTEGRLARLHGRVLDAAEGWGADVAEDRARPYAPHVTVARVRGPARVPEAFFAPRPPLAWRPAEVALVASVREGSGPPVYRPLAAAPLGPA